MIDKKNTLQKVIALNISLVIAEIIAGIYSGSMALIADAFHNLGDVLALFISLIAIIYGAKKASESMTFGYVKAEIMAAFINSLFLIITMIFILVESINRFLNPTDINAPIVIFASLIALFINAYSTILLKQNNIEHNHEHDENEHNHKHEDMNIKSAYLHMLGDAVISLSVAVGGVIIYFFGIVAIDSVLSVIFSLYIIKETFPLLKKSFYSLMDSNIDDLKQIENLIINSNSHISSIHDLHLYRPNSNECYGSVHIVLNENLSLIEIESISENIRLELKEKGINHFIIQPESIKYHHDNIDCLIHL
ncbi:cation transporter [Arcobacter cryaerophilus gv. occultus]|uniref:cation diffusion facilitator family transporter n=1 Tax=Aliarcobacter cryaerophilus TaxID=28198 RepID=UPI000D01BE38|nr:cation diffusion facilitator family transporter [Aliarcobacter cryaerophilus]PRM92260.1 cation transporter [Arcobacter cryaerophilus gv. occultus]